jgi:hypothetical protein
VIDAQHRAIEISRRLNAAETQYRKTRGVHPAHPWSQWDERPRAGAIWSLSELLALNTSMGELLTGPKLGTLDLCELAWRHGRSANGVNEKLKDVLGRQYYKLVDIT